MQVRNIHYTSEWSKLFHCLRSEVCENKPNIVQTNHNSGEKNFCSSLLKLYRVYEK